MRLTRYSALLVIALAACSSVLANSRRIGPRRPSRDPGCALTQVSSPNERPATVIGEVTCDTAGDEGNMLACREQIRDQVCDLGGEGFAARTSNSGRIEAVALVFSGAAGPGPGPEQGPGPGWGPGGPGYGPGQQQQMQQQQMQQQQLVQPQPQAGQCVPPCPAGSHCSADGRRCEPDAGSSTVQASLTDEQIQQALDRIRRRVLRCRPRGDENDVTVELEIEPGGSVASVRIDGPLANTDAGGCIEQAVFRATFPTFEGENRSVRHSFAPANP